VRSLGLIVVVNTSSIRRCAVAVGCGRWTPQLHTPLLFLCCLLCRWVAMMKGAEAAGGTEMPCRSRPIEIRSPPEPPQSCVPGKGTQVQASDRRRSRLTGPRSAFDDVLAALSTEVEDVQAQMRQRRLTDAGADSSSGRSTSCRRSVGYNEAALGFWRVEVRLETTVLTGKRTVGQSAAEWWTLVVLFEQALSARH
jgi:hypothetical protein